MQCSIILLDFSNYYRIIKGANGRQLDISLIVDFYDMLEAIVLACPIQSLPLPYRTTYCKFSVLNI